MYCNSQKIVVCTADNRYSQNGYWNLTDEANSAYCKKHNYDYKRYDISNWYYNDIDKQRHMHLKRHPSWLKIQVVKDIALLAIYDIIVWIDSDVIIQNHSIKIEEFLRYRGLHETVICDFISDGEHSSTACCGIFFLWARHSKALDFLESWNTFEYKGTDIIEQLFQYFLNNYSKQYEQRILKCIHWPYQKYVRIINAPSFFLVDSNQFFYHCANFIKDRTKLIKNVYDKIMTL